MKIFVKKSLFIALILFIGLFFLAGCKGESEKMPPEITPVEPDTELQGDLEQESAQVVEQKPEQESTQTISQKENGKPTGRPKQMEFTISMEGMEELAIWTLFETKEYGIYYDAETLEVVPGNPTIFSVMGQEEDWPEVWMSVDLMYDVNAADAAQKKYEELSLIAPDNTTLETVKFGPYWAPRLDHFSGTDYDSPVFHIFYVDLPKGGCARITLYFYLEATEGWGAQLFEMAQTFQLN